MKKSYKSVIIILALIGAVIILMALIFISNAAKLGKFKKGQTVQGEVYEYEVSHSSAPRSGYHCFLYCRYIDENGRNYKTSVQYNFTNTSYEDAEKIGKRYINKSVKMYINGTACITEIEFKRYPFYVAASTAASVAGAACIAIPLTVIKIKNKRAECSYGKESYLN